MGVGGGGVTALTKAVWAVPCENKSPPENFEYHPKILRDIPKKSQTSENLTLLLCVFWKISQVSRFAAKSSDSWKNLFLSQNSPSLNRIEYICMHVTEFI